MDRVLSFLYRGSELLLSSKVEWKARAWRAREISTPTGSGEEARKGFLDLDEIRAPIPIDEEAEACKVTAATLPVCLPTVSTPLLTFSPLSSLEGVWVSDDKYERKNKKKDPSRSQDLSARLHKNLT